MCSGCSSFDSTICTTGLTSRLTYSVVVNSLSCPYLVNQFSQNMVGNLPVTYCLCPDVGLNFYLTCVLLYLIDFYRWIYWFPIYLRPYSDLLRWWNLEQMISLAMPTSQKPLARSLNYDSVHRYHVSDRFSEEWQQTLAVQSRATTKISSKKTQ
jgi:hypothetical protein